jgi:hypothetical protein
MDSRPTVSHYPSMVSMLPVRIAVFGALALAACSTLDRGESVAGDAPDPSGWQLASGKSPTRAEFAAFAATCQTRGGAFDSCLADLGLKRSR